MKLAAAILLATLAASSAHATRVLDQSFTASNMLSGSFSNADESFRRAQVVTAGITGFLDQIDVQTGATGGFSGFNILSVANGLPTKTVLGTASFASAANGFASFSSSLYVTSGEQFAIEPIEGNDVWEGQTGGYPGGSSAYLNTFGGINNFTASTADFGFKTYVDTTDLFIDQTFTASNTLSGSFSSADKSFRRAQVITAQNSGTLARIDIQTDATGGFGGFNILAVENGLPTTNVLGTATFVSVIGGYATFTSALAMTAGEEFALEPIGSNGVWQGQTGGYPGGGSAYLNTFGGINNFTASTADFGFKTYFLPTVAGVPEPASWATMIAGFALIGAAMRRRRTAVRFA